jgi:hypothetical protein
MRRITGMAREETLIEMKSAMDSQIGGKEHIQRLDDFGNIHGKRRL